MLLIKCAIYKYYNVAIANVYIKLDIINKIEITMKKVNNKMH